MEISFRQRSFGVEDGKQTGEKEGKTIAGRRKSQVSKGEIEERIRKLREEMRESKKDQVSLPYETIESPSVLFKKTDPDSTSASPREHSQPSKIRIPHIPRLGFLLSTVKQQRLDHQAEENHLWELDFRAKERKIESLISEGKSISQKQANLTLSVPVIPTSSRVSLDTPTMKEGLRMMSRWPTVASLSSPQAGEHASSSGSLLSTLQRELRMSQFRADASDREVTALKLGQEETERKLMFLQIELENMKRKSVTRWKKRPGNEPETKEFERLDSMSSSSLEIDSQTVKYPSSTQFQGLFSLRKQRISSQIRAFSTRHGLWMDDLKSILSPILR